MRPRIFCIGVLGLTLLVPGGLRVQQKPLEVRVTTPSWENGYLKFSIDRINHSSTPLYLPSMGMYVSLAVNEDATETDDSHDERWVNIYGLTDVVSWAAKPIAPGATVHVNYSFRPAIAVVNLKQETRREIPMRGKLRVEAFYFLSEEDWQNNMAWHHEGEASGKVFNPWYPPAALKPQSTTVNVKIPCHEVGCNAECNRPPIVLSGENRVVPDIFSFDAKANARGKVVGDKLVGTSPVCSEDVSLPD